MPKLKERTVFSETQLYIDSVSYIRLMVTTVIQLPRPIQYSMGELALKDATRLTQLMRLAYGTSKQKRVEYIDEAVEKLSCLEVTTMMFFECGYIGINRKAELCRLLGSMQKQSRAWRDKTRQQTLSADNNDESEE